MDGEPVAPAPFRRCTDRADQLHQRLGVADARYIVEGDGMLGEQRRSDDRQRRVLVAGRLDGATEPVAALNDILDGRHATPSPNHFPTWFLGPGFSELDFPTWMPAIVQAGPTAGEVRHNT